MCIRDSTHTEESESSTSSSQESSLNDDLDEYTEMKLAIGGDITSDGSSKEEDCHMNMTSASIKYHLNYMTVACYHYGIDTNCVLQTYAILQYLSLIAAPSSLSIGVLITRVCFKVYQWVMDSRSTQNWYVDQGRCG